MRRHSLGVHGAAGVDSQQKVAQDAGVERGRDGGVATAGQLETQEDAATVLVRRRLDHLAQPVQPIVAVQLRLRTKKKM